MKKADLKPVWDDYRNWEEYKHGMYENGNDIEKIDKCLLILTSPFLKQFMIQTTKWYKNSTRVNFTNKMFNPVSWLGQATCNLHVDAKAQETCKAWMLMTKEQQTRANNIAKEVIEEWRKEHEDLQ